MTGTFPSELTGVLYDDLAEFDFLEETEEGQGAEEGPEDEGHEAEKEEGGRAAAQISCQLPIGVGPEALFVCVICRAIFDWKYSPNSARRHARTYGFDGLGEDLHLFFEGGQCDEYLELVDCHWMDPMGMLTDAGHPWHEPPPLRSAPPPVRSLRSPYRRKLNPEKVQTIRELWVQGHSAQALARRFDVDANNIRGIVANRRWKVPGGDVRPLRPNRNVRTIPREAIEKLGLVSDVRLAKEYHVPRSRVQAVRRDLGIAPCSTKYRNRRV